jgi:hypothetical protein
MCEYQENYCGDQIFLKEMLTLTLNKNILAIALPSLRISPLLLIGIPTIVLLYAAAFYGIYLSVVYIQSIGSGIGVFSGLFHDFLMEILPSQLLVSSLLPIKPRKLNKSEQEEFVLTENFKAILVGLILGDISGEKRSVNTRFLFKQGVCHEDYLRHLYELFASFCSQGPKIKNLKPDTRTGKVYTKIWFNTYSLPCFNELYNTFYLNGVKIVPQNIGDLLTPLGLAYLICDDGNFSNSHQAVRISTNSFSFDEVQLLVSVLSAKFNLNCTVNKDGAGFRLRISKESLPVLQALLKDIMPPMMMYKIGL